MRKRSHLFRERSNRPGKFSVYNGPAVLLVNLVTQTQCIDFSTIPFRFNHAQEHQVHLEVRFSPFFFSMPYSVSCYPSIPNLSFLVRHPNFFSTMMSAHCPFWSFLLVVRVLAF